jgi:hypothetical protein
MYIRDGVLLRRTFNFAQHGGKTRRVCLRRKLSRPVYFNKPGWVVSQCLLEKRNFGEQIAHGDNWMVCGEVLIKTER